MGPGLVNQMKPALNWKAFRMTVILLSMDFQPSVTWMHTHQSTSTATHINLGKKCMLSINTEM